MLDLSGKKSFKRTFLDPSKDLGGKKRDVKGRSTIVGRKGISLGGSPDRQRTEKITTKKKKGIQ